MIGLDRSNPKLAGSSAMSGPLTETQALASIFLWNSGHFDTKDIADVLHVKEDAVYRTLHASRDIIRRGE